MIRSQQNQKEEFWKDHISRWQQSGQSRKQYCLSKNLSYWTFRHWQKKIGPVEAQKLVKVPRQIYTHVTEDESALEIVMYERISIRITSGFNGKLLRELLTELGVRI